LTAASFSDFSWLSKDKVKKVAKKAKKNFKQEKNLPI